MDSVQAEQHSAKGRCDLLVKTENYIYAIELKLDGTAAEALTQIKEKGYLAPYAADPRKKTRRRHLVFFGEKSSSGVPGSRSIAVAVLLVCRMGFG